MTVILQVILFGGGLLGLLVGWLMKRTRPEDYARIGQRTEVEAAEGVA